MKFSGSIYGFLILIWVLFGCAGPVKELFPPQEGDTIRTVYIVSHGWHTGLVVEQEHVPDTLWPVRRDFSESRFLEMGWGDSDYYRGPGFNFFTAAKAALWPTNSTLHIAGFTKSVREKFPASEIIAIDLSEQGFIKMCHWVHRNFALDENGSAIPLGEGLYGKSRFYLGRSKYYFPKTSNTWVAKALREAGCPLAPLTYQIAGSLMRRAKDFGTVIQEGMD